MYVILLIFHLHKQEECKRNMNFQPKHPYHYPEKQTSKTIKILCFTLRIILLLYLLIVGEANEV